MPTEPRFLVIDLHKNKAVLATTDEMQALLWRYELIGETYFGRKKQEKEMDFGKIKVVQDKKE